MKYIIFEILTPPVVAQQRIPFIFPNNFVHALMAAGINIALEAHHIKAVPVSAGEVRIFGTEVSCSGKSDTLGLESSPADAMLIHNFDYTHGIPSEHIDEMLARLKAQAPTEEESE